MLLNRSLSLQDTHAHTHAHKHIKYKNRKKKKKKKKSILVNLTLFRTSFHSRHLTETIMIDAKLSHGFKEAVKLDAAGSSDTAGGELNTTLRSTSNQTWSKPNISPLLCLRLKQKDKV